LAWKSSTAGPTVTAPALKIEHSIKAVLPVRRRRRRAAMIAVGWKTPA
jgi:hypothetical protein